jgi:hypothetical protein
MIADRRQWLRLAGATALFPLMVAAPARAHESTRFAPPASPMRYRRTLRREMADGTAFTVMRAFAVRFVPEGPGYRVEGEQTEVTVEAPAKLAQFAELERRRRELGLFPLELDAQGLIHGARGPVATAELDMAVRAALKTLDRGAHTAGERAELDRFVANLHQNAAKLVTELPRDLFAPVETDRTAKRDVTLADGAAGVVTVRFTAHRDPATGLMEQARREVLTELSGDRRRTVESWILVPL